MSLPLLAGLSILCGALPASAERSIVAEVAAVAPFDAGQLTAAMRVRLPADGPPVRVRVSATPDGVRIEARGAVREVALRELTGAEAARLVALAANDLLLDDLATLPLARTAEPRPATTLGLVGAAAAWEHVLGGLAIDVAIPRGAWLVAIDAGGGTLVDGPLRLTAAVVRIGGGARLGWLELRAGATLAPVIVSNGDGDRTLLAGAGASARLRLPIAAGVRAILAAGIDVFATRTTYLLDGMPAMSTPRGAPWLAAGMELTPVIHAIAVLAVLADASPRPAPADADAALVARHRAGDPDAFAAIYRAHAVAVYRRLTRILGPIPEREDLTQDVFLAVHRGLPRFRGDAQLSTLIHRIAINRAYEHLRRQTRRPVTLVDGWFLDDLIGPATSPELQSAARQDLARVFACLARIKPKKRIAFLLRVVEGLSFEEIGQLVDATPEAVAKRVQHGQRELDELLARADPRPT